MSEYRQYPRLNGLSMRRVSRYMEMLARDTGEYEVPQERTEQRSQRQETQPMRGPAIPDPWDAPSEQEFIQEPVAQHMDLPIEAEAPQGMALPSWDEDEPQTVGFGRKNAPRADEMTLDTASYEEEAISTEPAPVTVAPQQELPAAQSDVLDWDWDALLDPNPPTRPIAPLPKEDISDYIIEETPKATPVQVENVQPDPAQSLARQVDEMELSEDDLARAMAYLSADDDFLVTGMGKRVSAETEPVDQNVAFDDYDDEPGPLDQNLSYEDEDSSTVMRRGPMPMNRMRIAVIVLLVLSLLSLGVLGYLYFFTDLISGKPDSQSAFAVYLGDQAVGCVANGQEVLDLLELQRLAVEQETGLKAALDQEFRIEPITIEKNFIATSDKMAAFLQNRCTVKVEAVAVIVDGQTVGNARSEADVNAVMQEALEPFQSIAEEREFLSLDFVEAIEIQPVLVDPETVMDIDQIRRLLITGTGATAAPMSYTVQEGDSLKAIANANDMSVSQLRYVNPSLIGEDLIRPGMKLSTIPAKGLLTVRFTERVETEITVPYETETRSSSKLYTTQKEVERKGQSGQSKVVAERVYVAGVLFEETILSEEVITKPVNEVVVKGTKKATAANKSNTKYIMPTKGKVSSRFGSRWGSAHKGLDIAASTGTPIYAARDGKVTFSGTNGTYGKLIKIDHGGGVETRYAHCSSLKVSKGAYVKQGDLIALVGSTGRSTGPHLHFEVRIDGTAKDPEKYLP